MFSNAILLTLAAAISSTSALRLAVNNWCNDEMRIFQANPGYCSNGDMDMNRNCGKYNTIAGSGGRGNLQYFNIIGNNQGTSIKMSRAKNGFNGITQYEYTLSTDPKYGGLYWDLSMLDGNGPSRTGSPWFNDNVKVSPTGSGSGSGNCIKFRCYPGKTCVDAYQHPADKATRFCPANTGDMFLDLCEPNPQFGQRRRGFPVVVREDAALDSAATAPESSEAPSTEASPFIGVGGLHDLSFNATHGIHE